MAKQEQGAAPSPSSSLPAKISSAQPKKKQNKYINNIYTIRQSPDISPEPVMLYIVCLFCFRQKRRDNEVDTLPPFVIRYLANPPVEKPNFRPHNQNWQLWQTNTIEEEFLHPRQLYDVSEETAYDSYYTHYTSPDSMDCGSDNLLVTFDYGYSDSIEARADTDPGDLKDDRGDGADPDADAEGAIWFGTPPKDKKEANLFEVHHVQHKLLDDSMQSLISYDVDDFEEEELSDAEPDQDEEIFYDSIECV